MRAAAQRDELQQKLVQFGDNAAIQRLMAEMLTGASSKPDRLTTLGLMATVARTRVKTLPPTWMAPLDTVLAMNDNDVVALAVSVARPIPVVKDAPSPLHSSLVRVARDAARPLDIRLDAVAAAQDPGSPINLTSLRC